MSEEINQRLLTNIRTSFRALVQRVERALRTQIGDRA